MDSRRARANNTQRTKCAESAEKVSKADISRCKAGGVDTLAAGFKIPLCNGDAASSAWLQHPFFLLST